MKDAIIITVMQIVGMGGMCALVSMFVYVVAGFLFTYEIAGNLYYFCYCMFTILSTAVAIGNWDTEMIYIWLGYTIYLVVFFFLKGSKSSSN